ncbi:MAG: hypothetical protein FWE70_02525 [Oscillospiraceae bacterium]|nr:hypothetical protein [Oscillospiraceae bacterium]
MDRTVIIFAIFTICMILIASCGRSAKATVMDGAESDSAVGGSGAMVPEPRPAP